MTDTATAELATIDSPKTLTLDATDTFSLIREMALNPDVDADKLEKLTMLHLKLKDRQAEEEYREAKTRIKLKLRDIKIIKKRSVEHDIDKNNKTLGKKEAFRFAPIEDIKDIVDPLLAEEGITDSYTTEQLPNGWSNVTCRLTRGTYTEEAKIPMPFDTHNSRSNAQSMGSTYRYGERYALCAILGLVVRKEDDDGTGGTITNEQAVDLDLKANTSGINKEKFLAKFKVASIPEIRTKDYVNALGTIAAYEAEKKRRETKKN